MKLVFRKDEDHQIRVFQAANDEQKEFSYVEMIKELVDSNELEEPDISSDFTEAEIKSIRSMVSHINKEISVIETHDDASVS